MTLEDENRYQWKLFASFHRGLIAKALKSVLTSTASPTLTVEMLLVGLYDVAGKKLAGFFELEALERLKREVLSKGARPSQAQTSNRSKAEGYVAVHDERLTSLLRSAAIIAASHGLTSIELPQIVAAIALDDVTLTQLRESAGLSLRGLTEKLCHTQQRST